MYSNKNGKIGSGMPTTTTQRYLLDPKQNSRSHIFPTEPLCRGSVIMLKSLLSEKCPMLIPHNYLQIIKAIVLSKIAMIATEETLKLKAKITNLHNI